MIFALKFTCWISLIYYTFSICLRLPTFVADGEPVAICCPKWIPNYTVTWYINGTPINTDNHFRIHQERDLLWFSPATVEDSGIYECRNHKSENGTNILEVFQNNKGLCFNENMTFKQEVFLDENGKLKCPNLDNFKTEDTTLTVQWFKDCQLLKDERVSINGDDLTIKNVTKSDEGIYRCQTTYTYKGKQYTVSRAIHLYAFAYPKKGPVEIIYPHNNSLEIEPGGNVVLECNASVNSGNLILVKWLFSDDDHKRFENESTYNHIRTPEKEIAVHKFNITKVKPEDYKKYTCVVLGQEYLGYTHLILKRPDKNFQKYLIGGLISPLLIIFSVLIIYKFFKVDIVLWYRESCQYFPSNKVSDGKFYDGYVLYPQHLANCTYSSYIFVMKVLPEVLEKQCGYKLFIFGRDDLPGQALLSVADETIKQSRRVIIILTSNSFSCTTQELASEHELAVYRALIRDGIKVILIEIDKINYDDSVPQSIKYLKQKHGVLTWRGDLSKNSQMATTRFWKNVRFQMPTRRSQSSADIYMLPP